MPSFVQSIHRPPRSFVKTEGEEILQAFAFFEDVVYHQWKKQFDHLIKVLKEQPDDLKESATFFEWHYMASGLMGRFINQGFNFARFKRPTDQVTIEANRAFLSSTIKAVIYRLGSADNTDENLKEILSTMVETPDQQSAFFDSMIPLVSRAIATALVHLEYRMVEALKVTDLLFKFTITNKIKVTRVVFQSKEEGMRAVNTVVKAMIQAKIPNRERLETECYERTKNLLKQKLFGQSEEWCSFCGKGFSSKEEEKKVGCGCQSGKFD